MAIQSSYLESAKKQFLYCKFLGERTFEQLTDDDLFWQANKESNSIAVIVGHLYGNMRSRWTDFLIGDGEKEWRKRDQEFEPAFKSRSEMRQKWEEGWKCLFDTLEQLGPEHLEQQIYIRSQGHTVTEAINRQLAHYSYHVGQIVFIGKMIKGRSWQSLSIPKGGSEEYNAEKFTENPHREHFSDEILRAKE